MKNGMHSWICTAVLILVGISIALTGSVAAQSVGDINLDANDLEGSGTAADPYKITNATELQAMEDDLDGAYQLSANIGTSSSVTMFNPVGNFSKPFTGTLAGDGHTIQNLVITSKVGSKSNRGLFGLVANGTIQDITINNITATGTSGVGGLIGSSAGRTTIQDVSVNANNSGSVGIGAVVGQALENTIIRDTSASGNISGYNSAIGGVVGTAGDDTTIQNVSASVNVTGRYSTGGVVGSAGANTTLRDVSANGSVEGSTIVGGLVGYSGSNTAILIASASTNVKGSSSVGGLVGYNLGSIQNASATGTVSGNNTVGGLVGAHGGVARDTFAAGEVTTNTTVNVGGLVGTLNLSSTNTSSTVSQSYWDTEATNQPTSAGSATGLTTTQMQGQAAAENMDGFDFDNTWTTTSKYPALRALSEADENVGNDSSGSPQVQLSNITLTPQSVDSDTGSTHRLSFEAQNVSADGSKDNFDITFSDKVEIISYSDVEIEEKSSGVDMTDNTLEFSVDPTGGGSTQISGELNVTVSATS